MSARRIWKTILALAAGLAVVACHRDLYVQPYKRPLQPSGFFADRAASRPLVEGTVATDDADPGPAQSGFQDHGVQNGLLLADLPVRITPDLLARGQERYQIFCAVCHGSDGYGEGMIVQRGFPPPPSFHNDRLRQAPAGHFFDVMTRGYGVMYSYASRVPPEDRWAITAYIRALQLSQHLPATALPPDLRVRLDEEGKP